MEEERGLFGSISPDKETRERIAKLIDVPIPKISQEDTGKTSLEELRQQLVLLETQLAGETGVLRALRRKPLKLKIHDLKVKIDSKEQEERRGELMKQQKKDGVKKTTPIKVNRSEVPPEIQLPPKTEVKKTEVVAEIKSKNGGDIPEIKASLGKPEVERLSAMGSTFHPDPKEIRTGNEVERTDSSETTPKVEPEQAILAESDERPLPNLEIEKLLKAEVPVAAEKIEETKKEGKIATLRKKIPGLFGITLEEMTEQDKIKFKEVINLNPESEIQPIITAETIVPETSTNERIKETPLVENIDATTANEKAQALATLQERIGMITRRLKKIDEELAVIRARRKVEKETIKPALETQIFSNDFIKSRIMSLLEKSDKIDAVKSLEVRGVGKEISLKIKVASFGFNIGVEATLKNQGDALSVKNYNIDAMWPAKGKAEKALVPYLNQVSEVLKSYIEKEAKKKVEKIEIENGQLKVTFKKVN